MTDLPDPLRERLIHYIAHTCEPGILFGIEHLADTLLPFIRDEIADAESDSVESALRSLEEHA